jgi:hypothetical protein
MILIGQKLKPTKQAHNITFLPGSYMKDDRLNKTKNMYMTIWAPCGFGSLPYPIPSWRFSCASLLHRQGFVAISEAVSSECQWSVSFFFLSWNWSSTRRRATPQFLAASVPTVSRWLIQPIAPLSSSYLQPVCSSGLSRLRTAMHRSYSTKCLPSPLCFGCFCLLYLYMCHWMLLQAAGLMLSAVVVTVRFLGITVIGALVTLKSC